MPPPLPKEDRTSGEGAPLPPELALLAHEGFDAPLLERAAFLARAWDVTGDEALISTGLAREEAVYRALARSLELPYLEEPFRVHSLARFPEAVLGGIAQLADGERARFAFAPRGIAFADLARRRPVSRRTDLAICTPTRLRLAVFAARSESIARAAAESLARVRPEESYYDGVTLVQLVWIMLGTIGLAFAAVAIGGSVQHATAILLGLPFLGLTTIKLGAALERVPAPLPHRRTPDRDLPVYTLLVPLYRESRVLSRLVRSLEALDYPAAKIDCKILIEEGDGETAGALAELSLPGFVEVIVVPPGRPRTKPRALNVGLALARGRYLVVYDAEDVPDPGQLRDAVAMFAGADPDLACLQARLVIDNTDDGHLTRFFTVEYGALFDVINPALPHFDLPMPLGGTSNHLRGIR